MKRLLLASILGLAATGISYGQARFFFDTYLIAPSGPAAINFALHVGPLSGPWHQATEADGYVGNILWQYGTVTGDAGLAVPFVDIPGYGGGWITARNSYTVATAASYSVDNMPITFTIQAWRASEGTYATALSKTYITWTDTTGFIADSPVFDTLHNFPGWVPEPSTFSLMALGGGAFLLARKRQ